GPGGCRTGGGGGAGAAGLRVSARGPDGCRLGGRAGVGSGAGRVSGPRPAGVGAPAHLAAAAAPFSHLWECGDDSVSPMGATFALSPTGGNFASQPPWLLGAGRPRSGAE